MQTRFEKSNDALFWARVQRSEGCWLWTGAIGTHGYGRVGRRVDGRQYLFNAHRYAWLITFGDPGSLYVLHHCDNRRCVRPEHLFLGTAKDNTADMHAKGRASSVRATGERHGLAKLSDAEVAAIRSRLTGRYGELSALAREFKTSVSTVHNIARGTTRVQGGV